MLNQKNSDQNENNKNTNLELFQINVDNNNTDVELDPMKLKIDENRDNVAEKKQTLGKFFYCYWLRDGNRWQHLQVLYEILVQN